MNWANLLGKWTMRTIHGAVLAAALLGAGSIASAQTQPAASPTIVQKNFTKSLSFDLPVRMDAASRAELTEIRLYVKAPNQPWNLQEKGPASLDRFKCRVPQDGEYWYTLVTVDRAGRPSVADVNTEPPSQRVIIDTTMPMVQVQTNNGPGGEMTLQCSVLDANPDPNSLKAVCRTEVGDVPLDTVAGQPNTYKVRPEMMKYPVLVTARDLAANVGTKEVNLRDTTGAVGTQTPATKTPTDIALASGLRGNPPQPLNVDPPAPITKIETPPPIGVNKVELPPPPVGAIQPQELPKPVVQTPTTEQPKQVLPQTTEIAPRSTSAHQLIHTTQASLEYKIDQVGPSGVGKVEVFMTPDNGQSWHKLGEDSDKISPAQINLPGDGVYGIRVVVSNGNGFGGKTPLRGDAPQCTIEVDTTSPFVQLRSADVHAIAGHVEVRWNATDKNLGTEPVTLSFKSRVDGPWQVIQKNVKNDGLYRWSFPKDAGGQFYFKIDVTDQAGNVASDMSRQATVIDVSEPRATVVGVVGTAAPRPMPPVVGNGGGN